MKDKRKHKKRTGSAVALAFQPDKDRAPRVVAKGEGSLASHLVRLAKQEDVPVIEDAALESLLHSLPVNKEIPQGLYHTVAALFAMIRRIEIEKSKVPSPLRKDRP